MVTNIRLGCRVTSMHQSGDLNTLTSNKPTDLQRHVQQETNFCQTYCANITLKTRGWPLALPRTGVCERILCRRHDLISWDSLVGVEFLIPWRSSQFLLVGASLSCWAPFSLSVAWPSNGSESHFAWLLLLVRPISFCFFFSFGGMMSD